ncbi:MAG: winged helix-turn-helix transcriptional regulator [Thermoproteota archaeon]
MSTTSEPKLDDNDKAILKALKELGQPSGCSDVAKKTNLKTQQVTAKVRKLKTLGLVESPQSGKYVITAKGEEAIKQ